MIDYSKLTPLLTSFSLLFYLYVVLSQWKIVKKRTFDFDYKNKIITCVFWIAVLFAMTPFFAGDFYHYIEWVEYANVQWDINPLSEYEIAYQYISSLVNGSYYPFRLIVWGGEILIIALTARRFNINVSLTLFLLILLFPVLYTYARASLAMAIYFYGLSFILKPSKSRILSYLLGVFFILLCPAFHRSMYILIAITPIALIPLFYSLRSSWRIIIYIFAIVIAVYSFSKILLYLDLATMLDDETLQNKLHRYSERDVLDKGPSGKLQSVFSFLFKWGSLFIFIKYCLAKIKKKNTIVEKLFVLSTTILFIGVGFGFSGNEFYTLSYRIANMYFIPFTLMLGYSYQHQLIKFKYVKYMCLLALINNSYSLLYAVYLSIVK